MFSPFILTLSHAWLGFAIPKISESTSQFSLIKFGRQRTVEDQARSSVYVDADAVNSKSGQFARKISLFVFQLPDSCWLAVASGIFFARLPELKNCIPAMISCSFRTSRPRRFHSLWLRSGKLLRKTSNSSKSCLACSSSPLARNDTPRPIKIA